MCVKLEACIKIHRPPKERSAQIKLSMIRSCNVELAIIPIPLVISRTPKSMPRASAVILSKGLKSVNSPMIVEKNTSVPHKRSMVSEASAMDSGSIDDSLLTHDGSYFFTMVK